MDLQLHDILELKKDHPCGSRRWEVLRVGMDFRLRCLTCGREMMIVRGKAEKSVKKILPGPDGKLDLEHINTLDVDLFRQDMEKLLKGEEVELPTT